jgi:hypothetical protein
MENGSAEIKPVGCMAWRWGLVMSYRPMLDGPPSLSAANDSAKGGDHARESVSGCFPDVYPAASLSLHNFLGG